MGAKQSKRSVDISGKEAEGAGEVAVAGAGGEGRVEQIADSDAVKPQLNGDAHIHDTDKEKQVEIGTPENEKDATTEKESKEQDNEKEKEIAPVTNGDSGEQKPENGIESPQAPEDGKKPKKERVKKKWSLRSISFSRKDKPKQEKKQKEEEPKTNGEAEKVPEEAAEVTTETTINEIAEEAKPETDSKAEKTPETPVTEPITNGSTTPESQKVETPIIEETVATNPETDRPEPKAEVDVEQLPVNGLSLEEAKSDEPEVTKIEESKPDQPAELTESVPAPEIPVTKEVCVEQMPLIEPTPPPLPANPPPSSVASFAATTMAPELTDASLANTTETPTSSLPAMLGTKADLSKENIPLTEPVLKAEKMNENSLPLKEISPEKIIEIVQEKNNELCDSSSLKENVDNLETKNVTKIIQNDISQPNKEAAEITEVSDENMSLLNTSEINAPETIKVDPTLPDIEIKAPLPDCNEIDIPPPESPQPKAISTKTSEIDVTPQENSEIKPPSPEINLPPPFNSELIKIQENSEINHEFEDLPPPPPIDNIDTSVTVTHNSEETLVNSNVTVVNDTNDINDEYTEDIVKTEIKDSLNNVIIECNGNNIDEPKVIKKIDDVSDITPLDNVNMELEKATTTVADDSLPPSLSETNECLPPEETGVASNDASESFPLPPSELCRSESEVSSAATPELNDDPPADIPQEHLPVTDKIADLIPEVPVVPELKTELETTTDVAVAN
ncbi:A-kinase anchor protein 200-like [Achroia grisella]|uniref:A-kinase anchor protein 200-like n=1 Tax=Achroia grisella TaxID=688607 RepID=UPI0027D2DB4B|nr:A-kinase anchor protein 200-like [Achroia grisella]